RRQHRTEPTDPPIPPPHRPARPPGDLERLRIPRLDSLLRPHVDHQPGPISQPGEEVRGVTPPPLTRLPAQPARLRRKRHYLTTELHRHDLVASQPRLVSHMPARGRRPPQPWPMRLTSMPTELPYRRHIFKPVAPAGGQRPTTFIPVTI